MYLKDQRTVQRHVRSVTDWAQLCETGHCLTHRCGGALYLLHTHFRFTFAQTISGGSWDFLKVRIGLGLLYD
jgi:hypothetical protein